MLKLDMALPETVFFGVHTRQFVLHCAVVLVLQKIRVVSGRTYPTGKKFLAPVMA
jgi:hypothetical protein